MFLVKVVVDLLDEFLVNLFELNGLVINLKVLCFLVFFKVNLL